MAKETMTVNNNLDEVKLEKREKMDGKKKEKKNKEPKQKNEKRNEKKEKKENFFKQVRKEMKMVTWPSKKSVVKYSFATILMILAMTAFFIGVTLIFDLLYALVQGWIG